VETATTPPIRVFQILKEEFFGMRKEQKSFLPNVALRQAREEKSWSQRQVAIFIDTNPFTVCRWECGSAFPSPHYRQKLCELFAKRPYELGLLPQNKQPRYDDTSTTQHLQLDPRLQEKPLYAVVQPRTHKLIERGDLLSTLKKHLCAQNRSTIAALYGLPGTGKTALALELAYDDEVRAHFPDGIIWVRLGQFPDLRTLLSVWAQELGLASRDIARLESISTLGQMLTSLIGDRSFLFVIDDAWDINDALAFKVGGGRCGYLLTTRSPSLASQFAHRHAITVRAI
jgi:transcriptional regulator with XRE-family HTH domain